MGQARTVHMTAAAETQPLNKEVSFRFLEGSVGPETKPTDGVLFDGNTDSAATLSTVPTLAEETQSNGQWASVVAYKQSPGPITRAQWLWFVNVFCLGLHLYYIVDIWLTTLNGEQFEATVWRTKPVWNATAVDGHMAVLMDNMMPIQVSPGCACQSASAKVQPTCHLTGSSKRVWNFQKRMELPKRFLCTLSGSPRGWKPLRG